MAVYAGVFETLTLIAHVFFFQVDDVVTDSCRYTFLEYVAASLRAGFCFRLMKTNGFLRWVAWSRVQ